MGSAGRNRGAFLSVLWLRPCWSARLRLSVRLRERRGRLFFLHLERLSLPTERVARSEFS